MEHFSRRDFLKKASVAALSFAAPPFICACSAESNTKDEQKRYVSPYNFSGLKVSDTSAQYVENGVVCSKFGVDVSQFQGDIDWKAVKAKGVDFAFVRIGYRGQTEGQLYTDELYEQNLVGARNAGLNVGAYFYSQATTVEEAKEEALFCKELLSNVATNNNFKLAIDLPLVFDFEKTANGMGRADALTRAEVTDIAVEFCTNVAAFGYRPMIYGNQSDLSRYESERLLTCVESLGQKRMQVWFAEYNYQQPTAQFDFSIWQYSNAGVIDGIEKNVDLNILFTTTFA